MGERRAWRVRALLGLAVLATLTRQPGDLASAGPTSLPARVVPYDHFTSVVRYPVLDPAGNVIRHSTWLTTNAGTNCCESYVAATRDGRVLTFGGTYPAFSDDRGATWHEVQTLTPLVTGEGAITAAPGGDVVGIGWDAYSGDHLNSFKYDAETKEWRYAEVPLHEPFFDRPWIAVVKGPFEHLGQTVPYASVVMSNFHNMFPDAVYISYDGLQYTVPTAAQLDSLRVAGEPRDLAPRPDVDLDVVQPNRWSGLVTLPVSGLLDTVMGGACRVGLLGADAAWRCLTSDVELKPETVIDSRGWIHDTEVVGDDLLFRTSADGGLTWESTLIVAPNNMVFDEFTKHDVKVHGTLRRAGIAAHLRNGETYQDMVFILDVSTPRPVLSEIRLVGQGDLRSITGNDDEVRFDFSTLAFLPDGTVATSFRDSTVGYPHTAIEQG